MYHADFQQASMPNFIKIGYFWGFYSGNSGQIDRWSDRWMAQLMTIPDLKTFTEGKNLYFLKKNSNELYD